MTDLFEQPENLPAPVQEIIEKYTQDFELSYGDCENFLDELKPYGYTFEYYLGGVPFNLTKI